MLKQLDKPFKTDWKTVKKFTDKSYSIVTFQAIIDGNNLIIKGTSYNRKSIYWIIENFKQYAATQIFNNTNLGRNFEDCILKLYHENGFELGYTISILRDFII